MLLSSSDLIPGDEELFGERASFDVMETVTIGGSSCSATDC